MNNLDEHYKELIDELGLPVLQPKPGKWKLRLWNNWSRWLTHEIIYSTEDAARLAAKKWDNLELWDVEVVEIK